MKPARIPWEQLLEIVETNREKHEIAFKKAYIGWLVETNLALVNTQEIVAKEIAEPGYELNTITFERAPKNHLKDYDRLIAHIKLTDEEHIELDSNEFDSYVNDEWSWKREFILSNTKYGAFD